MSVGDLARYTESIVLDWEMAKLIHHCQTEGDRKREICVWLRRQQVSFNEALVRLLSEEVGRTMACFGLPALELLSLIRYDTSRVGQEFHRKFLLETGDEPKESIVDMWVREVSGKAFASAHVRSAVKYLKARPFPPPTAEPVVIGGTVVNQEALISAWMSNQTPMAQRYHGQLRNCSCFWDVMVLIYRWHLEGKLLLPQEHALAVVTAFAKKFCSKFMRHTLEEASVKRLVAVFNGSAHPGKTGLPVGPQLLTEISVWLIAMEWPDWTIVSNKMMTMIEQQRWTGATSEKPEDVAEPEYGDVFPTGNDLKALADDFALQHIVPGMVAGPMSMIAKYRSYLSPVLDHAKYRTWFGRYLRQNGYLRYRVDVPQDDDFKDLESWSVKFRAWVSNPHVARTYGEWFASCKQLLEGHHVDLTGFAAAKPYQLVNYLYDQKKVPFKGHVWFTDGKPATCAADETSDTISTKAEETMALNITTTVALNGTPIQSLTTAQIADRIASEERELGQLESLQNKPNRVKKDIEDRRAKLAQLVAVLDAADEADTPKAAAE